MPFKSFRQIELVLLIVSTTPTQQLIHKPLFFFRSYKGDLEGYPENTLIESAQKINCKDG